VTTNLHEMISAAEAQRAPGDTAPRVYNLRMTGRPRPGSVLLWLAAVLLLGLAAAQGYVSYRAQFAFIDAAKHARIPSMLEALGLDTGAVIFALLGLAHARIGRPARIERALNLACALGSMSMNLLGADLGSPRSVAVYVLPAVLYAACSDRLIATAAAGAGVPEASLWRSAGRGALYGLRLAVAFPSTARGLRLRLLAATPLPGEDAPGGQREGTAGDAAAPVSRDASGALPEGTPEALPPGAPGRPRRRPPGRPRGRSRKPVTQADAEAEFMAELAAGDVPSVREIKRRLHVGDTRASALRGHLESVSTRP
jgi:hypothetical protein